MAVDTMLLCSGIDEVIPKLKVLCMPNMIIDHLVLILISDSGLCNCDKIRVINLTRCYPCFPSLSFHKGLIGHAVRLCISANTQYVFVSVTVTPPLPVPKSIPDETTDKFGPVIGANETTSAAPFAVANSTFLIIGAWV